MKIDYIKVMDWIRANWTKPTECPICGKDDWGIGDELVELKTYHGQLNIYPFFFVYCRPCGYTIFVNAIISGLIKPVSTQQPLVPINK